MNTEKIKKSLNEFKDDYEKQQLKDVALKVSEAIVRYVMNFLKYTEENNIEEALYANECFAHLLYDTLTELPSSVWNLKKEVGDLSSILQKKSISIM